MGAVTFSIDPDLVRCLGEVLPLDVFVETGTFEGEGVDRMLPIFEEIHTIEIVDNYFERARERFADERRVQVHHGDSRLLLGPLKKELSERPVVFWLDAHWCGGPGAPPAQTQCPLLGELDAIGHLNQESVVLIDDARLFLATPPEPHDVADWPRFHEVAKRLTTLGENHELMVINDVIVCFPSSMVAAVSAYAHTRNVDLLAATHRIGQLQHEVHTLREIASERLAVIEEKEREINVLAQAAKDRLMEMDRMASELSRIDPAEAPG